MGTDFHFLLLYVPVRKPFLSGRGITEVREAGSRQVRPWRASWMRFLAQDEVTKPSIYA